MMIAEFSSPLAQSLPSQAFVGPEVGWFALSPMLALLVGALTIMVAGALTPTWPKGLYALASAATAGTAGALAMVQWDDITDNGTRITYAPAANFQGTESFTYTISDGQGHTATATISVTWRRPPGPG